MSTVEHFDVLIVGAGLSGVGAACHLLTESPGKTFTILEERAVSGGTWDLFRYPGVRSDSDMFTLGYSFMPWREAEALASGPSILRYIRDTARTYGVDGTIRYRHRVVRASWSSGDARWTVEFEHADSGEPGTITCSFLFMNTGYYRYDKGYTPQFEGTDRFRGRMVHPQQWPGDLDCTGQQVVVIGSGATAVTIVPALAASAAHVTMVQRSPSYVLSVPEHDAVADLLRRFLPPKAAHHVIRWKNVGVTTILFQLSRRAPEFVKGLLRKGVESQLPNGYDVATHFNPHYQPWDQRLCLTPDGDLFKAISCGRASVVTDRIDSLTERGLLLASGDEIEADVVITATGLNMRVMGGMAITVDGTEVDVPKTVAYKGIMLCGVPNLALTVGYTNASWTLKADLAAHYVCRLLNHMDQHGQVACTPRQPDPSIPIVPFMDLTSGYVQRALDILPKQAKRTPWRLHQNYPRDVMMLRYGDLSDEMEFSSHTELALH
jgi:monooxygenase